jgi:hypothetical protein
LAPVPVEVPAVAALPEGFAAAAAVVAAGK